MSTKVLERAKVAALVEDEQRTIEFYAAAFSRTPDKHGDRIDPHAFDAWLEEFYKTGVPLPLSYAHAAMLNGTRDPFDIVGYAPADSEHVWVDDYGLRIKGFLEVGTNTKAQQVFSLASKGLLKAASLVFDVPYTGEETLGDGSVLIKNVAAVREAGPCIEGANDDAYVISVKTSEAQVTRREKWSGDAAMAACSSAEDYGKIAFRRTGDSDPDTAAAWALPHHPNPDGAPGNADAAGVAAALAALNGGRGGPPELRDPAAARSHLEAHQSASKTLERVEDALSQEQIYTVTTEVKHAAAPNHLQIAHDALVLSGAKCKVAPVEAKSADLEPEANDDDGARRHKSEEPEVQEMRDWIAEHTATPKPEG